MQRKIMKMGPSSLVVSLPAEFTSKYKIKKGDEITIINTGDSLVIKTEEEATLGACNINISDYNPIIMRVLGVLYKAGYDEINVKYEPRTKTFNNQNYSELDLIQKSADLYPGMDIISIKNEKALLKENSKIVAEEFDNYLNQAFLNLHQMSMNIYGAVKNSNYSSSQEIDLMEKLLNQNTNFCLRMISKKTYSD
ncbi:AbrB/MazE/SpoVT family DNA-binding domain-containing protein, partial [Candidatus Woesearchaeota archaeon]|nr:AbrB/MazE/SpoVT family DNA-binding domain-containing protein [Candidatus Woesearchaeota archaeon]